MWKYYEYEADIDFENRYILAGEIDIIREKRLRHDILSILKKYIFFPEDDDVVKDYSTNERILIDKYGDYIPRLLQQVMSKQFQMSFVSFTLHLTR